MSSCIIHLDLDSFYAQVEAVRLGIDPSLPVICTQWHGILAVNYPARAFGISRKNSIKEAIELCPHLVCAHVPTLKSGESEPSYHVEPDIKTHKASLFSYRDASDKIMKIVGSEFEAKMFQKASVDECYIDATKAATEMMERDLKNLEEEVLEEPLVNWNLLDGSTYLIEDCKSVPATAHKSTQGYQDLLLFYGARISAMIRARILNELGYTASTGISTNKTLVKIISSTNKPNKQTILLESQVLTYMASVRIKKIPRLAGKFGDLIVAAFPDVDTANNLWDVSVQEFESKLDVDSNQALWLHQILRGIFTAPVQETAASKSMQSSKNFYGGISGTDVELWINNLCAKLFVRLMEQKAKKKWPKTVVLSMRIGKTRFTKQTAFLHQDDVTNQTNISAYVMANLYNSAGLSAHTKVFLMAVTFTRLEPLDGTSIRRFFQNENDDKKKVELLDDDGLILYLKCSECGLLILMTEKTSHADYHFARNLQGKSSITPTVEEKKVVDIENTTAEMINSKQLLEVIDEDGLPLFYKCIQCHKIMERKQRLEHEDMHFAFSISKSSRVVHTKGFVTPKATVNTKEKVSKKSTGSTSKGSTGNQSIKSFFAKKA